MVIVLSGNPAVTSQLMAKVTVELVERKRYLMVRVKENLLIN
jgi:hypothetical protein